jgi:hypothetical protein
VYAADAISTSGAFRFVVVLYSIAASKSGFINDGWQP